MKKLNWILPIIICCSCSFSSKKEADVVKPNIVLLLADDLGYGELGSYGQQMIKTPVLDSLANRGMLFTDFYAGNAVCSPSRAVLLTGKSSTYNTIRGNNGYFGDDRWMRVSLKKDEVTLAEMLRDAGYQTGFVGKWHLGDPNDVSTWAFNRGFDFAIQEQWSSRFGGTKFDNQMHYINGMMDSIYYHVDQWNCKDEFRTNLAFDYLDTINRDQPFFLFMSYRAPHGHERSIGNKELYKNMGWSERERTHAAKITLLDRQIGRMLAKLEDMGELENTLVLFTSDNGPHQEGKGHSVDFFASNGPLKGIKRDMYEGGLRVPLIAYWKGKILPGTVSNHISGFQDLMPTFADMATSDIPSGSNGLSLLPTFLNEGEQQLHSFLNWEIQLDGWYREMPNGGFRQSVRLGNWKGVRYGLMSNIELYNLETDLGEENNVAKEFPELMTKIESLFNDRSNNEYFPKGGVFQDYKPRDRFIISNE